MAAKNNTSPLGTDDIGIDISNLSENGRLIQEAISREAYRDNIDNAGIANLRKSVYKMVATWSTEKKVAILRLYGDMGVANQYRDKDGYWNPQKLSEIVTESMIIHLNKSELKTLVTKTISAEQSANKTAREIASEAFTNKQQLKEYSSFKSTTSVTARATKTKLVYKYMKSESGKSLITSRPIKGALKGLDRELRVILKDYNRMQLAVIASDMEIDFAEGEDVKIVINSIINKCYSYVVLYTNKSTKGGVSKVGIGAEDTIRELISLTSYAKLIGIEGISAKHIKDLKDSVRQKHLAEKELERRLRDSKKRSANSAELHQLTGGSTLDDIDSGRDNGILAAKTPEELMELAIKYNLNPKRFNKTDLYLAMANEASRVAQLKRRTEVVENFTTSAHGRSFGRLAGIYNDLKLKSSLYNTEDSSGSGMGSGQVPIVSFDEAGAISSSLIKAAVPVVVVGYSAAGQLKVPSNKITKKYAENIVFLKQSGVSDAVLSTIRTPEDAAKVVKMISYYGVDVNDVNKKGLDTKVKLKDRINKALMSVSDLISGKADKDKIADNKAKHQEVDRLFNLSLSSTTDPAELEQLMETYQQVKYDMASDDDYFNKQYSNGTLDFRTYKKSTGVTPSGLGGLSNQYRAINNPASQYNRTGQISMSNFTGSSSGYAPWDEITKKDDKGNDSGDHSYLYNTAAKKLGLRNINTWTRVTPVYITNGFTEYIGNQLDYHLNRIANIESGIYEYLDTSMPLLFAGLQEAGTSFNLASAGAVGAKALTIATDLITSKVNMMFSNVSDTDVARYATGGYGKAGYSRSQFISGDSLTGKPNEELVDIDWNKKTYNVKPLRTIKGPKVGSTKQAKFAIGGTGNSDTTKTSKMTSLDRSSPISVNISNSLVKYNQTLPNVTDDGTQTAIKVYPITPGITDLVDVNGTKVSLIGLLANSYVKLTSIEALMASNVQISASIASNTSSIAASAIASKSSTGSSFSSGFPENLNSILEG